MPEYFKSPYGTGSLLDMSTSGLELSNKQLRSAINNRSYRGDAETQIADALKHGYLCGSRGYKKVIDRDRVKTPQHCSVCRSTEHRKRNCPLKGDPDITFNDECFVDEDNNVIHDDNNIDFDLP